MVGMTKTAPDGPTAEMHYALFSCSHWAQGYFHPYDHGSILEKLDWWVHVGDYIYEYGVSTADDFSDRMWGYSAHRWPTKERMDPPWEIVELNDYRRRYAVYHTDHGLQQLRARAPMIATWDDHEITNNWFFQGAQNHQSTCPADATACDEHEGSWVERVNAGAIAYLEWLPIRRGPDDQSGLMNTDIKQVIEWGDLATIVSVDTRGYARSADYVGGWQKPGVRIASGHYPDGNPNSAVSAFLGQGKGGYAQTIFEEVVDPTNSYTFDQLTTPGEEAYDKAIAFKEQIKGVRMDPSRKKLGDYQMEFMMEKFAASKEAGKTWQIFADATTEAAWSGPDLRKGCSAVPENETACLAFTQDKIDNAPSGFYNWKTLAAISAHQIALYNDDSNACAYERMMMMRGWKENTNNLISLSGDVHDSRADVLFTDGEATGTPEGVHFTQGGVTCQWWGDTAGPHGVTGLAQEFGLNNGMKIAEQALEESTPGTKMWNLKDRGFWAFKVTHEKHVAEHINANYDAEYPIASSVCPLDVNSRHTCMSLTLPFVTGALALRGQVQGRRVGHRHAVRRLPRGGHAHRAVLLQGLARHDGRREGLTRPAAQVRDQAPQQPPGRPLHPGHRLSKLAWQAQPAVMAGRTWISQRGERGRAGAAHSVPSPPPPNSTVCACARVSPRVLVWSRFGACMSPPLLSALERVFGELPRIVSRLWSMLLMSLPLCSPPARCDSTSRESRWPIIVTSTFEQERVLFLREKRGERAG